MGARIRLRRLQLREAKRGRKVRRPRTDAEWADPGDYQPSRLARANVVPQAYRSSRASTKRRCGAVLLDPRQQP